MIKAICLGKIKEDYLNSLITDYEKRINKYHKLEIMELKDNLDIKKETEAIMGKINPNDYIVALAIEGKKISSTDFAKLIDETFIKYPNITFIIGASNGLSDEIKAKANLLLSFSDLTFPHGLFRGMLLEQIYRACKINNNETYHK